eukprot:4599592-Alexandrium_andersonii.AAC.1
MSAVSLAMRPGRRGALPASSRITASSSARAQRAPCALPRLSWRTFIHSRVCVSAFRHEPYMFMHIFARARLCPFSVLPPGSTAPPRRS